MNKTITIVVSLLIGLVAGYAFGIYRVTTKYAPKIAAVGMIFPAPTQIFSVTGKVTAVDAASLTIGGVSVSVNPFAGDFPVVRQVAVNNTTKITAIRQKDSGVILSDTAAFQKKMQAGASVVLPPSLFEETDIALTGIKVGDTVTVSAASDILGVASFTATKIQLAE